MAIIEEIKKMQSQGKSEQDITLLLQQQGYGIKEASDAISQAKIKQAVADQEQDPNLISPYPSQGPDMHQSMMASQPNIQEMQDENSQSAQPQQAEQQDYGQSQDPGQYQQQYAAPPQPQQYAQQEYAPQDYAGQQQYQQYDPYSSNTDTISDIAEQVVAEKLSSIRKQLENAIALKSTTEAKIMAIDERLKRMEKIIDRLQLSVLQKVGEYVTNVEDIKKEMIETQKSFKSLVKPSKSLHQN